MKGWLAITEYSNKYKVSISTLRRRIRSGKIRFIYEDGKYFLTDAPYDDQLPNNESESRTNSAPPQKPPPKDFAVERRSGFALPPLPAEKKQVEPLKETKPIGDNQNVTILLAEIKKAYTLILQEKEEQILILKDEVADLQTLVKVLENENNRIKAENSMRRFQISQTERGIDPASDRWIDPEKVFENSDTYDLEIE